MHDYHLDSAAPARFFSRKSIRLTNNRSMLSPHSRILAPTGAFLLLSLLTMLVIFFYDPYLAVGPELLDNPTFSEGLAGWNFHGPDGSVTPGADGTVRLESGDPSQNVVIYQKIAEPQRFTLLRLAGFLRTVEVVAGSKGWHQARLVLASYDRDGKWLAGPHHVVSLASTHNWKRYAEVFRILPGARELRVMAQLPYATGTMQVGHLSLRPVEAKSSAPFLRILFLAAWGGLILWVFLPLLRAGRTACRRVALAMALLAVLIGTLTPGDLRKQWQDDSVATLESIGRQIATATPDEAVTAAVEAKRGRHNSRHKLDRHLLAILKAAHFLLFGTLACCLALALPGLPLSGLLGPLGMLATATEFMQFFIRGRTALYGDWLIDLVGALVGLGLYRLIMKRLSAGV